MREIKFRVYDTEKKKLSYGFSIQSLVEEMVQPVIESWVDNLVWQQYTGLKDKNGVEIYEGDIVEIWIEWYNTGGMGEAVQKTVEYKDNKFTNCFESKNRVWVVGNIFEGVDK